MSGQRGLLERKPSREQIDGVRSSLHALDKQIKKLSREGSTLKEELDKIQAKRGSIAWENMRHLPMREIMAIRAH